jgi:hypothetical protein
MNTAEFCDAIGFRTGLKRQLAEKIRDVTAALCRLDLDAIDPATDNDYLCSRMFDGWDELTFLMKLEEALNVEISDSVQLPNFVMRRFFFFYKKPKPLNYGEWVKSVVEILAPIVADQLKEKSN